MITAEQEASSAGSRVGFSRSASGARTVGDVLDVAVTGGERVDLAGVGVEADDLDPFGGERHRQRQPDVADADHRDSLRRFHRRQSSCATAGLRSRGLE
ncbi:MAG: hypothetical protein U0R71_16380 [Solirubrobacterales bacterium]